MFAETGQDKVGKAVEQDQQVIADGTEFCQPFAVLHRDIKHIAMENPGFLPVEVDEQFIDKFKGTNIEFYEFPHQLIMVTGDVNEFGVFCDQAGQMSDHHQVRFWEVTLAKLPDVDDISVQDERFGFDASQVLQQLLCMTSEGSEMHIRNDDQVNFAFG